MDAYEAALSATSKPWAPWYAIPADDTGLCDNALLKLQKQKKTVSMLCVISCNRKKNNLEIRHFIN